METTASAPPGSGFLPTAVTVPSLRRSRRCPTNPPIPGPASTRCVPSFRRAVGRTTSAVSWRWAGRSSRSRSVANHPEILVQLRYEDMHADRRQPEYTQSNWDQADRRSDKHHVNASSIFWVTSTTPSSVRRKRRASFSGSSPMIHSGSHGRRVPNPSFLAHAFSLSQPIA